MKETSIDYFDEKVRTHSDGLKKYHKFQAVLYSYKGSSKYIGEIL